MRRMNGLVLLIAMYLLVTASSCSGSASMPTLSPPPSIAPSIAPTETLPATPRSTATSLPSPSPIPVPLGRIELPYRVISPPIIDDDYVYWQPSEDRLVQESLTFSYRTPPETVVTSLYPKGRLTWLPMQQVGDWVYFVDMVSTLQGTSSEWMVRAVNLRTRATKVIFRDNETGLIYGLAVDPNRLAMTLSDARSSEACPNGDAILAVVQLDTGVYQELDRQCFQQVEWEQVALTGDLLFATKILPATNTSEIVLVNLKDRSIQPFGPSLAAPPSGLMTAQGSWVAWDTAGGTFLDNLANGEQQLISPTADTGPLQYPVLSGRWLYWTLWRSGTKIVVYDLVGKKMKILAMPGENEMVWNPSIFANTIAWVRVLQSDQATGNSNIEWTTLNP